MITPQRVIEFLALLGRVRDVQRQHRSTVGPAVGLRNELKQLEDLLDSEREWLGAELAADLAQLNDAVAAHADANRAADTERGAA